MKLPIFQRLTREDFLDVPWIDKLLSPLNRFMEVVAAAFSQGLTFQDNVACAVCTFEAASADLPIAVKATINGRGFKPLGVLVLEVRDKANPSQTVATGSPSWSWDGNDQVTIHALSGLSVSRYQVKILVLAG